jgi:hypothetical protein
MAAQQSGKIEASRITFDKTFKDYILNSIIYLEYTTKEKQFEFLEKIHHDYWISLFIVDAKEKIDISKNVHWSSIILTDIEIAEKIFPLENIMMGKMTDIHKLLIIQKLTWDLLKSEYLNNIFINNKDLNFTIIILSFEESEKHLLNYVDNIMFEKTNNIKDLYQKCFLVYPIYEIFKNYMNNMENDTQLLYIKKSKKYISCSTRFLYLPCNIEPEQKEEIEEENNLEDLIIEISI